MVTTEATRLRLPDTTDHKGGVGVWQRRRQVLRPHNYKAVSITNSSSAIKQRAIKRAECERDRHRE